MIRRLVTSGRVSCPLNGDVDIERCASCPALRQLKDGSVVRCAPLVHRLGLDDPLFGIGS